jgi:hypothetical protein
MAQAMRSSMYGTAQFMMIVVSAALALVGTLLGGLSITPIIPYLSTLYVGVAFQLIFGDWFGLWGGIGVFIGCAIGEVYLGFTVPFALILVVVDFLDTMLFAVGAKTLFKYNFELKSRRDWIFHIIYNCLIVSAIGGIYGTLVFIYVFKFIGPAYFWPFFLGWTLGNFVVLIIVGTILMKFLSPYVMKTPLYVRGYVR